ncbi:MAG: riboflavin biosynthesis protein RibF [Planctomycetota bacterium]|nr:riboflavin biosynthesis protein RibF [Planctomycetota bacterium]
MRRHVGREALDPGAFQRPVATIGVFDGLHRGHAHVIEHLRAFADRVGGEAVVVTFDTHPMAVIAGAPPRHILSTEHRLVLLERLGLDAAVVLPFDEGMRQMPFDTFVSDILVAGLGMRGLLFGYNSNFGHRGAGTPATVAPQAAAHGFEIVEAPAIHLEGTPISSSRIRDAIERGAFAEAAAMLGRPHSVFGAVVRGDGRGRQLGFPTANIDLGGEITPPAGVYQVIVALRGQRRVAVANLGYRPTFGGGQGGMPPEPILEVHIPGVDFEFYGEPVEVEFVRKIRDERAFPSKEALLDQIRADVASLGLS